MHRDPKLNYTTMPGMMESEAAQQAAQTVYGFAQNAIQNRYYKKQAAQQNQYNIDMWNRNNEYNTPANQMARFQAAGLNPNLIYGQGNAGNSGSPPSMEAPIRKAPHMDILATTAQRLAIENAKTQGKYLQGQVELQQTQQSALEQKIEESKSKVALNAANKGLSLARGEMLHYEGRSKFGYNPEDLDEIYKTSRQAARLRNLVLQAQIENYEKDLILKGDVHTQKAFDNKMRENMGMMYGDNIITRGAHSLLNEALKFLLRGK